MIVCYQRGVLLGFAILLAGNLATRAEGINTNPQANVDLSVAFRIGPTVVSNYLITKFYLRFADDVQARKNRKPTEYEANEWLAKFVSQQAAIAEATTLGYLDRTEVESMVSRMECNMLSSPSGPYSAAIQADDLRSSAMSRISISQAAVVKDLIIGRFPNKGTADKLLGTDFIFCDLATQRTRMLACRKAIGIQISSEPVAWPYFPFPEIADAILSAPIRFWKTATASGTGYYFIFVTCATHSDSIESTIRGMGFDAYVARAKESAAVLMHRRRVVADARIAEHRDTEDILGSQLIALHLMQASISKESVTNLSGRVLCTYEDADRRISVSVEDFRQHFNDQFVRHVPKTGDEVHLQLEDLVVEAIDCRAAYARGIDKTRKFQEDRRGFAGYQALDLYERERIIPHISIELSAVEAYYAMHLDDFTKAILVRGKVLEFASMKEAGLWIDSQRPNTPAMMASGSPLRAYDVQLAQGELIPGFEYLRGIPLSCADGSIFGPITRNGVATIFERRENTATSIEPLSTVEASIRSKLQRAQIDARLLAMAPAIEERLGMSNHINLYALMKAREDPIE